jgi:hypothetical protein
MLTFLLGWIAVSIVLGLLLGIGIKRVNQEDDDADL